MAKRKRSLAGVVGINLGDLVPSFNSSVKLSDAMVGAGLGAAGGLAARYAYNQIPAATQASIPMQVSYYAEEIGAAVTGLAAFMLQKKSNPGRAAAHAGGAIAYALASAINSFARDQSPAMFSGVVSVNLGGGHMGLLVDAPPSALNGLIVADTPVGFSGLAGHSSMGQLSGMGHLAAASLGDCEDEDNDGGLSALSNM